jgi:hypothetical protein
VSCDDSTSHIQYNSFKTIITEDTIDTTSKGKDTRLAQNIMNLIITTNYLNSLRFSNDDRRICPTVTNNDYSRAEDDDDFEEQEEKRQAYFDPIYEEIADPAFCPNLFTYFINYDTKRFRSQKFPITKARSDIVEANKSAIELYCEAAIDDLQHGVITDIAYQSYKELCAANGNKGVYSKQKFLGEMKVWTDSKKDSKPTEYDGKRHQRLYLNAAGSEHFRKLLEELKQDQEIPVGDGGL